MSKSSLPPSLAGGVAGASRFFSGYYIVNFLLIASYALVHSWFMNSSDLKYARMPNRDALEPKERQAFTLLLIAVSLKFFKRQSMDAFFSDAFTFAKGAVALLAFYIDTRIFVYYIILYIMAAIMFPQPFFKGPSRLEHFTPASFADEVTEDKNDGMSWLVEFYAPWAPECLYLEPVIAELSLKYSSETLRFGKIDVSRWPAMAATHRISVRGERGNQLPTLIMFEKGKEVGRIPHVAANGKVASGKFRRQDIVTAFSLDDLAAARKGRKARSSSKSKETKAEKKTK